MKRFTVEVKAPAPNNSPIERWEGESKDLPSMVYKAHVYMEEMRFFRYGYEIVVSDGKFFNDRQFGKLSYRRLLR